MVDWRQECNEVRWRPGQKTNSAPPWSNRCPHGRSLAPLWSNPSSFEGKFIVLKKVLVTLLGIFCASSSNSAPLQWFRAPIVNWRPGNCDPLAPPRYAPDWRLACGNNRFLKFTYLWSYGTGGSWKTDTVIQIQTDRNVPDTEMVANRTNQNPTFCDTTISSWCSMK